jgi:hypothetical protein
MVAGGHGLRGLQGVKRVSQSGSFPDANVAFIAALAAYFGSVLAGLLGIGRATVPIILGWLAAAAVVGASIAGLVILAAW